RAVRFAGGRDRIGRRFSHRIQLAQIRALLHGRVRQHDDRLGAGDDLVSGRMEWAFRQRIPLARRVVVPGQSLLLPVSVHLAARDASAFPLRPVDEFRMEGSVAGGDLQHRPGFSDWSFVPVNLFGVPRSRGWLLLWNLPKFSFWVSRRWPWWPPST